MVMATLAMTLVSLLPDEDFLAWGWRIPFLLSAVLVLLGLWIRTGIDETPDFQEAKASGNVAKVPLVDTLKYHWREVLIATGAKVVETAPFYVFTTFAVGYATGTLQLEKMTVLNAISIASLVTVFMIPVMGALSDRIGRKAVFFFGALLMGIFAAPYFLLLDLRSNWSLTIATVIVVGFVWAPIVATLGTFMSEIFSTRVRYTGITLGAQLGAAIAGGSAPLIATWLQADADGHWWGIAVYIAICSVISIVAVSRAGARRLQD
ncbi:MFS transporter [Pseudomonas putida]|uniref:MFS transporter n=1 Tax=Pseudomonas putida TaxID=303 RepID=UPI00214D6FE1|nr:MFS transporter [Pseudomonas putida]